MIDSIIRKINLYKDTISKRYESFRDESFNVSKNVYDLGQDRIEIEKTKLKLKKHYSQLGLYIARQYILKGYSDFSLDDKFISLNNRIKSDVLKLRRLRDK